MYNIDNRASMAIPRCLTAVVYRHLKRHIRILESILTAHQHTRGKETIKKVDEARTILLSIFVIIYASPCFLRNADNRTYRFRCPTPRISKYISHTTKRSLPRAP